MKYTAVFVNEITGERGDIIEWDRPSFTAKEFKVISLALQVHAVYGWKNVSAYVFRDVSAHDVDPDYSAPYRGASMVFGLEDRYEDEGRITLYAGDMAIRELHGL